MSKIDIFLTCLFRSSETTQGYDLVAQKPGARQVKIDFMSILGDFGSKSWLGGGKGVSKFIRKYPEIFEALLKHFWGPFQCCRSRCFGAFYKMRGIAHKKGAMSSQFISRPQACSTIIDARTSTKVSPLFEGQRQHRTFALYLATGYSFLWKRGCTL